MPGPLQAPLVRPKTDIQPEALGVPGHEQSASGVNPTLDLFTVPPTDVSVLGYRMVAINTYTTGINPIDFQIDAQADFIDLSRSYFQIELGLKKANGDDLVVDETLWPVNNLAHSLFKQINVRLNGTLMNDQSDTYHYKAYLQTLMNFDAQDGDTVLAPQGWFNQVDLKERYTANNTDIAANGGDGHAEWQALTQNHKDGQAAQRAEVAHYVGTRRLLRFKPLLEPFQFGKLLVPGVQIGIQFYTNLPQVFLDGVALEGRLEEADIKMKMYLCVLRLNDAVFRGLTQQITTENKISVYPCLRSEVRTYPLARNLRRLEINNPFQSRVPNRMLIGAVHSNAFNGDYTMDPFCFQKFGITSIRQIWKGEEYPYETLQLNHDNGEKDLAGYHRFLDATGALCKQQGNMVRFKDWGQTKNCTLFAFDNVASGCVDTPHLNPRQTGELQIEIILGANVAHALTFIVYGEFENLLEVDQNQAVYYDIARR